MKSEQRRLAVELRHEGRSINSIASQLSVSKSSVSLWVREIKLSGVQLANLKTNSHSTITIEKRRLSRLKNEEEKRNHIIDRARKEVGSLNHQELWLIGVMLYWAEGGKTQRLVRFSNGDPEMIKIMMSFFIDICKVDQEKFRGYIHIHPHLDHIAAEKYWSSVSTIPPEQFFKTYRKKNISSKNKRNSLPYGVMDIYVLDTKLFYKIQGWAQGIFQNY